MLGTSIVAETTGQPWNRIRLPDATILGGIVLAIRELDDPSDDALATLRADPSITLVEDASPNAQRAAWVHWQEVENFFHSDRESRHYVVDYVEGTITFGDGRHGRIPPPGGNRIKLVSGLRGGGIAGNVPAYAINQLRVRAEGVRQVYNPIAAEGGMDAEPLREARERGPQALRHRERAVTVDDYEWLAREASRNVARAHCTVIDGVVNVLIVPDVVRPSVAEEALRTLAVAPPPAMVEAPYPSLHLIETVQAYLDQRRTVGARVRVSGPDYLAITVEMDVMLRPAYLARMQEVRQRIEDALRRFVHPVLGGPEASSRRPQRRDLDAQEASGWQLGRALHISEIYYVVEQIEEVDYAENVRLGIAGEAGFRDRIGLRPNAFPHFHRITVRQAR
jgi:predicted phage baseplate assembly protein